MATGDLQANVVRLQSDLKAIKYPAELDVAGVRLGVTGALLPVLNYALTKFSRHVAQALISAGFELQSKTDARFAECAFKALRDIFGLRPVLTVSQFLEQGFAERKILLVSQVIQRCRSYHNAAVRQARRAAAHPPAVMTRLYPQPAARASSQNQASGVRAPRGKPKVNCKTSSPSGLGASGGSIWMSAGTGAWQPLCPLQEPGNLFDGEATFSFTPAVLAEQRAGPAQPAAPSQLSVEAGGAAQSARHGGTADCGRQAGEWGPATGPGGAAGMGQGAHAGPESVSSHWQGLPQGQPRPGEPAESVEGGCTVSELSDRQRQERPSGQPWLQAEQQQWDPVPSAGHAAEHGARVQASSGAVSSSSGASNAGPVPTLHTGQLGAGVPASTSAAAGSRPGQQQLAPPRSAVLGLSPAGQWPPGGASGSGQADSRRPQHPVAAPSSSTPLQASDAWFLNPAFSGATRDHQEARTRLLQTHSAAAKAGDVSVLLAQPQDGDSMQQQSPGMQDVKAPVPSAQGGLDMQEGEPYIVVARRNLPVDLIWELEDQKQPGGRPQDASSSRDLQDAPSEFAYTITTGASSGSRVQSPRLPSKVLGREAVQQQQPSVAPSAGQEVAAAAGDHQQVQPAGALAGAGSAAAVLAAAERLSQQTGSLLARSTQQQAGPREQPAALQQQHWLPGADRPEASDVLSRTALPQEVPEGQQAADAEQVQPEAALPVNADMAELRARLAGAEAAGVATQAEIQRVKEVLGARVTILEGTVRFLEGQLMQHRGQLAALQAGSTPSTPQRPPKLLQDVPKPQQPPVRPQDASPAAAAGQYVGGKARTPVATTVVGQQTLQMPASPAASTCSVQSHRSTSDLIANLSSRHEEAQKFLRSYA